jgi:hypothetical protein
MKVMAVETLKALTPSSSGPTYPKLYLDDEMGAVLASRSGKRRYLPDENSKQSQILCSHNRIESRFKKRKLGCLLVVTQLVTSAAGAHSWYPKECCSDNDCRPVPCAELTKGQQGLNWRGRVIFSQMQIHESLDDLCHVCVTPYVGYVSYVPICVFIPSATN